MKTSVELLELALEMACKELVETKTRYEVSLGRDTIDEPSPKEYKDLFILKAIKNIGGFSQLK